MPSTEIQKDLILREAMFHHHSKWATIQKLHIKTVRQEQHSNQATRHITITAMAQKDI